VIDSGRAGWSRTPASRPHASRHTCCHSLLLLQPARQGRGSLCFLSSGSRVRGDGAGPCLVSVTSPPYERGESVESPLGGYGLYYRSPLAEFGIVARAGTLLGDLPITVDVLTESDCAAHMAAGFRSAVEATEYFQRWMLSTDPLPAEVLRDYAEVACLCRLPYLTDERDAVREAFFDGDLASTGIAPRPSPRCMEGARLAEARLRLIEGRLVQAGLPADRWLQVFKGFHRFLEVRKAVEIEAAFGVRLACPVDEHNSARHVSNDSPAQAPPSRDCPIFACHRPTARPGCLARRSAGSVAPRRARRPAPALPGAAGGPQAHAPARVRKAAGRPAFAGSPPAGRPDRPGHGPQLPRGAHRARTARFSSVSLRQAAARACGDVKSRKPW